MILEKMVGMVFVGWFTRWLVDLLSVAYQEEGKGHSVVCLSLVLSMFCPAISERVI
jgi:hypothetical protein